MFAGHIVCMCFSISARPPHKIYIQLSNSYYSAMVVFSLIFFYFTIVIISSFSMSHGFDDFIASGSVFHRAVMTSPCVICNLTMMTSLCHVLSGSAERG